MAGITTIVFGATGSVGSATARTAQERGAKVVLALRDIQKPIPGLSAEQERAAGFERVQADLSEPETVAEAVRKTGAKHAFIYALLGRTPDNMRAGITALKDAGIEFVVVLSSGSIDSHILNKSPSMFVAVLHGQIEASLDDVFGSGSYVADMVKEGEAKIVYPEATLDWITPGDIGRVCGSLLAGGPQATDGKTSVALIGPALVSLRSVLETIGKAIGKEVKVTQIEDKEGLEWFEKKMGLPGFLAKGLVDVFRMRALEADKDEYYKGAPYEEAMANVLKYGGRQPTSLEEWVDENKHEFSA